MFSLRNEKKLVKMKSDSNPNFTVLHIAYLQIAGSHTNSQKKRATI